MGNTNSRFERVLEKIPEHVDCSSWKGKRHSFIMLAYNKDVIKNMFSVREHKEFKASLEDEDEDGCDLSEHELYQLSDIGLFLTFPWKMPEFLYVAADTDYIACAAHDRIPKKIKQLKNYAQKDSYGDRQKNTILCISDELMKASEASSRNSRRTQSSRLLDKSCLTTPRSC